MNQSPKPGIDAEPIDLSAAIERSLDQLRLARLASRPLIADLSIDALKFQIDVRSRLLENMRMVRLHLARQPRFLPNRSIVNHRASGSNILVLSGRKRTDPDRQRQA